MDRLGPYLWVCLLFITIIITVIAILYFIAHPLGAAFSARYDLKSQPNTTTLRVRICYSAVGGGF